MYWLHSKWDQNQVVVTESPTTRWKFFLDYEWLSVNFLIMSRYDTKHYLKTVGRSGLVVGTRGVMPTHLGALCRRIGGRLTISTSPGLPGYTSESQRQRNLAKYQ